MNTTRGTDGFDILAALDARARDHQLVSSPNEESKQTNSFLSFIVCEQNILVPISGALLAIWVMRNYDVTEERAHEIRAELEKRRGKTLFG